MFSKLNKNYLMTPGPTMIPESVNQAIAQSMVHHRTPEFQAIFERVRTGLQFLFQTKQDVLILASTGTGAMDAAVSNLFRTGDTVITINAGKFGERWTRIANAYGLEAVEIKIEPGETLEISELQRTLKSHPKTRGVLFQASETSTGVQLPTQEICEVLKETEAVSICDAITALGVQDLPMDKWGIDVLLTGSQKALMIPPGLAFIAISEKGWSMARQSNLPKFYFSLEHEKSFLKKNQTLWTPAISLIQGLHESLGMIQSEGLANLFKRFECFAKITRESVKAMGLELFATKSPSTAVTSVRVPETIIKSHEAKIIPKLMREKHGVSIVGGQEELESKIFRLSHLGYCDKFDLITTLSALELVLVELKFQKHAGRGVQTALQIFSESEF